MVALLSLILFVGGVSAATWVFPVLSHILSRRQRDTVYTTEKDNGTPVKDVSILVPVHNDELGLSDTLSSVYQAIARSGANSTLSTRCKFHVRVCLDGCSDGSIILARKFGAEVIELQPRHGKWRALRALIDKSEESDWVILVDCGVHWSEDFLETIMPEFESPQVMAVAPGYVNEHSGVIEKALWSVERGLKTLELKCGGPVTVHGATVCYERRELQRALKSLSGQNWLNDDVVIPLSMRLLTPNKRIVYLPRVVVHEAARSHYGHPEFTRRRRIVVGNLEWIRGVLVPLWRHNPIAACVSLRRVFRILWAYWLIFALLSIVLFVGGQVWPFEILSWQTGLLVTLFLVTAAEVATNYVQLIHAAWASILAPYYLLFPFISQHSTSEAMEWR